MRLLYPAILLWIGLSTGYAQVNLALVAALPELPKAIHESYAADVPLTLPFELAGAFAVVRASVDGRTGRYIIDSGAPGLILNRPNARGGSATTFAGEIAVGEVNVDRFDWGALRQKGLTAYTMDLSQIVDAEGEPFDGIIGYAQLRAIRLELDYQARRLRFLARRAPIEHVVALPFHLSGHVPVVRAQVAGRTIMLGLDTGAGINILDGRFRSALSATADALPPILVRGLSAAVDTVRRATVPLTEIQGSNWVDLPYGFADVARFRESGLRIDGLIGKEWLEHRVVTLDYRKRRIYVR